MQYSENEVVKLTQDLVVIESSNPGTYESALSEFVYDWFVKAGVEVHKEEVFPNRCNIVAHIPGEIDDPNLVYICHMDTVPIGEGWNYAPLKAEIIDGKLYGRGSCDMKAGLAAGMIAFRNIAAKGKKPRHSFVFVASVDEEDVMSGAEKAMENGWIRKSSYVLDSEPTNGYILVAHKGKTWFKITANGLAAHASTPENGVDSVAAMGEFIVALNQKIAACPTHAEMGPCSATYGLINGGTNTNIVPDKCTMTIDMRLVPPVSNEESIRMVEEAVKEAKAKVKGSEFEILITAQRPAVDRDNSSVLLAALKKAVETVQGKPVPVSYFAAYTDSAVVAAMTGCNNCMSFGPGDLARAHKPDEFCPCDEIILCADIMTRLAEDMLF